MNELAVVGHITIDRVITVTGSRTQLGGPPTYVSLVAQRLGTPVRAMTKVGGDMPSAFLDRLMELGIDLRGQIAAGAATTRFILDYRGAERRLSVASVCEEIEPEDVGEPPEAVLITPIVGEVPPETASALTGSRLIALDPQGFVRDVSRDGSVRQKRWFNEGLLRRITVYKSSERELALIARDADPWRGLRRIRELGAEVAIATRGGEGALLLTRRGRYRIPAYEVAEVVDPTGAGDAFIGAFLSEYLRGEDAAWCAAVGASAASCVVETAGASIGVSMRQMMGRAEEIHDAVVEL